MVNGEIRRLVSWLAGLLLGAHIVVTDEILTLALYCGRDCRYSYPLLGTFGIYDAYSVAVAGLLGPGLALTLWSGRGGRE